VCRSKNDICHSSCNHCLNTKGSTEMFMKETVEGLYVLKNKSTTNVPVFPLWFIVNLKTLCCLNEMSLKCVGLFKLNWCVNGEIESVTKDREPCEESAYDLSFLNELDRYLLTYRRRCSLTPNNNEQVDSKINGLIFSFFIPRKYFILSNNFEWIHFKDKRSDLCSIPS
jgi:hypothetical protein